MVPVRVINLDSQPQRWETCQRLLSEHGYRPIRFPGIVPTRDHVQGWVVSPNLKKSTIGCYLSHYTLMKEWYETTDEPFLLAAEDDISPKAHAKRLLESIPTFPKDAEFVNLACWARCRGPKNLLDMILSWLAPSKKDHPTGYTTPNGFYADSNLNGTIFYYVTRAGVRKILDALSGGIHTVVDRRIAEIPDLRMYNPPTPFATTHLTGACTDSSTSDRQGWACFFDQFFVSENITFGYLLFVNNRGIRMFDLLVAAVLGPLIALALAEDHTWAYAIANGVMIWLSLYIYQLIKIRRGRSDLDECVSQEK